MEDGASKTRLNWPLVGLINPKSFTDADDDIQVNASSHSKTQIKSV